MVSVQVRGLSAAKPWSASEVLGHLESRLPEALVSPRCFSRAEVIARKWPEAMVSFGFESHLASGNSDFAVCLSPAQGGSARFLDFLAKRKSEPASRHSPSWTKVKDCLREWSRPASALRVQSPCVWLSFEDKGDPGEAEPSIHVCLNPELFRPGGPGAGGPGKVGRLKQSLLSLVRIIGGGDEGTRRTVMECLRLLPGGGRFWHLSCMLSRSPQAWKANISLPGLRLSEYLEALKWPGNVRAAAEAVARFLPDRDELRLDLTIGNGLAPRLGIEFQPQPGMVGRRESAESLRRMMRARLCTAEKRRAILDWTGIDSFRSTRSSGSFLLARTWHGKLILDGKDRLSAKAYLAFTPLGLEP